MDELFEKYILTDDFAHLNDPVQTLLLALTEEVGEVAHEFKIMQKRQLSELVSRKDLVEEFSDVLRIIWLLKFHLNISDREFKSIALEKLNKKYF